MLLNRSKSTRRMEKDSPSLVRRSTMFATETLYPARLPSPVNSSVCARRARRHSNSVARSCSLRSFRNKGLKSVTLPRRSPAAISAKSVALMRFAARMLSSLLLYARSISSLKCLTRTCSGKLSRSCRVWPSGPAAWRGAVIRSTPSRKFSRPCSSVRRGPFKGSGPNQSRSSIFCSRSNCISLTTRLVRRISSTDSRMSRTRVSAGDRVSAAAETIVRISSTSCWKRTNWPLVR
ncbi:hypothetical protein D9M70_470900 [compost metagenome]